MPQLAKKNLLNAGCGERFHSEWLNLDFTSYDSRVQSHDLRKGIPHPNQTFDVVYHSHLLEHFSKDDAIHFIKECYRVLKPGGILRVCVPDLEQIARWYVIALEKAIQNESAWDENYQWMMIELYDQTVREFTGGEMGKFLNSPFKNELFVSQRIGYKKNRDLSLSALPQKRHYSFAGVLRRTKRFTREIKEQFIKALLGREEYSQLQLGRFRKSGEIHQWMYDRYSLKQLLLEAGFDAITKRTATESAISDWHLYSLDTDKTSNAYKPDSLYMEAVKP